MKFRSVFGAAAFCAVLAVPASAQQNLFAVTKAVEDWTVRCATAEGPSPCDMVQIMVNSTTKERVLQISIAYVPSVSRHTMQIAVPLGVTLAKGITLAAGTYKSGTLKYRRCDPNGCYIEGFIEEAVVQAMTRAASGTVTITGGDGKSVPVTFSLKGFSSAHDQMAELARQRAKTPSAAPAPDAVTPANP